MSGRTTRRTVLGGAFGLVGLGVVGCSSTSTSSSSSSSSSASGSASSTATPIATVQASGLSNLQVVEYAQASGDASVLQFTWADSTKAASPYTTQGQAIRHQAVTQLMGSGDYSSTKPLLVLNPYGTSTTGLLVGIPGGGSGTLGFTVSTSGTEDFSAKLKNHASSSKDFLGQLVGLVPGTKNTLKLDWQPSGGTSRSMTVTITPPAATKSFETQLKRTLKRTASELSTGLFVLDDIVSHGQTNVLVDNAGVVRGELLPPVAKADTTVDGAAGIHAPRIVDGVMITNITISSLGVINALGHVTRIIDLGKYVAHHDLQVVGDIAYVLASDTTAKTSSDIVLAVNHTTGKIVRVIKMSDLLPKYLAKTHARSGATSNDWVHINSIDIASDGTMHLSFREPSTIIALDNALADETNASVKYLIGPSGVWEGTGYEDLLLTKKGDFSGNAGQHMVRRHDSSSLSEGQYYLEFFNNNYWYMGTLDGWEDLGPSGASKSASEGASQLMRYLVDEKAGTYSQVFRMDVPYSTIMSAVQRLGSGTLSDPVQVASSKSKVFSERTKDGTIIAEYSYDDSFGAYRTYKYDYTGFWYA